MTDDALAAFRAAGDVADQTAKKKTGAGADATETRVDFTALVNQQTLLIQAIQTLTQAITLAFPKATGTSGAAVAGAIAPTNFVGYLTTTLPGTTTVIKIPYYN